MIIVHLGKVKNQQIGILSMSTQIPYHFTSLLPLPNQLLLQLELKTNNWQTCGHIKARDKHRVILQLILSREGNIAGSQTNVSDHSFLPV